jgi:Cu-processing system ATP-binding protein
MQEGTVHFHQTIDDLLQSTNEQKISKAIAKILKNKSNEQNH